jgi:hypothetical protein
MPTLPNLETARRWPNLTLVASDGSPVGRIESIYVDHATGRPEWALVGVDSGGNGARKAFVPLAGANEQANRVSVPRARALITDAPLVPAQPQLLRSEETRLYDHYGIAYSTAASPSVLPAAEADPSDLDHPLADDEMDEVGSEVDTSPGGGVRPKDPRAVPTALATEPLAAAEHARPVEVPAARGRGRLVGRGLAVAGLAAAAAGLAATRRRQPPALTERLGLSPPRRRGLFGGRARRSGFGGRLTAAGQALGAGAGGAARQASRGAAAARRQLGGRPTTRSGRATAAAAAAFRRLPGRSSGGVGTEVTRQMRRTKRKVTRAQRRLERAAKVAEQTSRWAAEVAEQTSRQAARQAAAARRRTARAAAGTAGTVAGATGAAARAAADTASTAARTAGDAAGTLARLPAATATAARDRVRESIPRRQRRSKRMRKMISRFGLAIGAATGYVLGTKAGRERYEQIVGAAKQLGERPEVKRIVEQAPGAIETKVNQVADKAADKVGQAREKVAPNPSTAGTTGGDRTA